MRQISRRIPLACLSVLLLFAVDRVAAQAQYFGRNKVQYKDFKFEVLKTDHFDIYFYEEERENAARVGRMAERWYARLSSVFDHEIGHAQPLILYASHPDFEQTNVVGGMIGEGTGGVTEGSQAARGAAAGRHTRRNRPRARPRARACIPIRHLSAAGSRAARSAGIEALPLWFVEGLAEYLSIGPVDPHTAMWLRDATRKEELPGIERSGQRPVLPLPVGSGGLGVSSAASTATT